MTNNQSEQELRERVEDIFEGYDNFFEDTYHGTRYDKQDAENAIVKLITKHTEQAVLDIAKKWNDSKEEVVDGKRYLIVDGEKLPYGYPYPDTRLKYMIAQLNKLKELEK